MSYDLQWSKRSLCMILGLPVNAFFEEYETNPQHAAEMDSVCNLCPVQRTCLEKALKNSETGCWAGVYLVDGKISDEFNKHKTSEDWNALWLNLSHFIQTK